LYDSLESVFTLQAEDWIDLYTSLSKDCDGYEPKRVTSYMHILSRHVSDFIEKHDSILKFSCQGEGTIV